MKNFLRNTFLLLSLLLPTALLSACDRQPQQEAASTPPSAALSSSPPASLPETEPSAPETEDVQSSETSTKRAEIPDFPPHLKTELNYLHNLEIPEGDPAEIVLEQGVIGEGAYNTVLDTSGWFLLGADADQNLLILETDGTLHRTSKSGEKQVLYSDLRSDPAHEIECVAWDGDSYVVWAEHPPFERIPYGVGWELHLLDLRTGEKRLIDRDQGLRPVDDNACSYVTPTTVAIADGYLSYGSYALREDGRVVQSIMLYEIASGKLELIGLLQGDPTENRMGAAKIGGGYVGWSQAYVRPEDSLYEGYSLLYDLSTRQTRILESTENLINPCMIDDWIICESNPNTTYYDSEIVAYQISKNQWRYKIGPGYPGYRDFGDNLGLQSTWGHYVTWLGDSLPQLLLLDLEHGVRYTMATMARNSHDELQGIRLYPGGLLSWFERFMDAEGNLDVHVYYAFLREEPLKQDSP